MYTEHIVCFQIFSLFYTECQRAHHTRDQELIGRKLIDRTGRQRFRGHLRGIGYLKVVLLKTQERSEIGVRLFHIALQGSVSLDDISRYVRLSKEYICTLFKRAMQQTIMRCFIKIRIGRARIYLLQYPGKRVLEVDEFISDQ